MNIVPSVHVLRSLKTSTRPFICKVCCSRTVFAASRTPCRTAHTVNFATTQPAEPAPVRKQLKQEARKRKDSNEHRDSRAKSSLGSVDKWKLTVGIEIHSELDTATKLFSPARTSLSDSPNEHVSIFDAALPGAQPQLQKEALLPALRAAIALGCEIQGVSGWDRKHYFWWDQPNGYQITQYYAPFAKAGHITLYPYDDIDAADHPSVTVGIKQIQLEQDTAKTVHQPPSTYMIDFNRASHPLIEIITLPQIHSPKTAAALVKKIQTILRAVGANTTGMEMGGLRADVNVSVQPTQPRLELKPGPDLEYDGVTGLGQRTEIKNLSSFKAVEDAIIAERDRQISVLEAGGSIEGETRGWTLGSTETKRLRGKEGEVDYRYMPDPDLSDLRIGEDLISHLRDTLPTLPDDSLRMLTKDPMHGLTMKDARTLISLDDGDRLEFYLQALALVRAEVDKGSDEYNKAGVLVANWILHDLPTYLASIEAPFPYNAPSTQQSTPGDQEARPYLSPHILAAILTHLLTHQITTPTARRLLSLCALSTSKDNSSADSPSPDPDHHSSNSVDDLTSNSPAMHTISTLIDTHSLRLHELSPSEYHALATQIVASNPEMARKVREEVARVGVEKAKGKIMWFVGRMVREGREGSVLPGRAEGVVRRVLMGDGEE